MNKTLLFLLSINLVLIGVNCLDNGLGKTPAMGWNSWNKFACNIDEQLIKQTADKLVSSGLASLGYKYVNLDDCWQVSRDQAGKIQEDKAKFPSGMKALAEYVHSKGLLFGLYSDAGTNTCAGRPGSLGYEKQDAQTYADWKIDYLKYDNCNDKGIPPKVRYPPMRDALNATGHPIYFSMCEWGVDNPATWAGPIGNSWRTTGDIADNYSSFLNILEQQVGLENFAGPGHWNDPDMLEVGNGGMTTKEYEAHFALWALLKSPLLIGCDLNNMSADTLRILSNKEVIAINQDPLGIQGSRIFVNKDSKTGYQIWMTKLVDGIAVILFNTGSQDQSLTLNLKDIGVTSSVKIRDLQAHQDLGTFTGTFSTNVSTHGVSVLKVFPQSTVSEQ